MKEKHFMKRAQSRGDSGFARVLTIVALMLTLAVTGAWAQGKVTLKEGTADADNWTVKTGTTTVVLGETEVAKDAPVTATYSGQKHVKSVKAVKKAPAYAANEYNEGAWDGTKVVLTKKTAASEPTAVADAESDVTWSDGWYTVSGNVTITGNVTLGADTHLILCDGATLTINGQLDCRTNEKNLYIYGQEAGDGKLNVSSSSIAISGSPDESGKTIEIHGGEITATSTSHSGFFNDGIKMYGGKLTATANATFEAGIVFTGGNFDVYGGEVEAINTGTGAAFGIMGGDGGDILTVYGGTVKATGGTGDYSLAIYAHVKSGTPDIKFYFAETESALDNAAGTTYSTATATYSTGTGTDGNTNRYAKAE